MARNPEAATLSTPVGGNGRVARVLVSMLRFLGLWAGISGTYAVTGAACPFCGQPGCPVGIGAAAILGLLGSFVVLKGRALVSRAWHAMTGRSARGSGAST